MSEATPTNVPESLYPARRDSRPTKVAIIGAGAVGSTLAYACVIRGVAREVVLQDINKQRVEAEALDIAHGIQFTPAASVAGSDDVEICRDADVVVITAGAKQKPGESRIDLLKRNAGILRDIALKVAASGCRGVMLVVSNPVDVLTRIALEAVGWDRGRVIGSGTVLDTARFRYALSKDCGVDARNVHGYILGEHGDSEFAAWSMTHVAGLKIDDYCHACGKCPDGGMRNRDEIVQEVRESAYHIIGYKGATYYAIGMAMTRIAGAILRNERSILSVSIQLRGEFGIEGVCLSVPCIVGRSGVERALVSTLPPDEQALLQASAARLAEAYAGVMA